MRYGLGTLRVDGEREAQVLLMALVEELHREERSAGASYPTSVERVRDLRAALAVICRVPRDVRDLLEVLPRGDADHGWLAALHGMLAQPAPGESLALTCCEHERGLDEDVLSLAVVQSRRQAEVRPGDVVWAGFAATSHLPGEVSIAPRLYRVRCTNGMVIALGDGDAQHCTADTVADAARACLSGAVVGGEVERLRQAADTPLHDPERLLQEARAHSQWSEVRESFERESDASVWGLVNAVTASARLAPTWAERLRRESDVAGILALLERAPLQRLRMLALELPHETGVGAPRAGAGALVLR